jgi:hypothetical protein
LDLFAHQLELRLTLLLCSLACGLHRITRRPLRGREHVCGKSGR